MRVLVVFSCLWLICPRASADDLSLDQQLIIACFNVNEAKVVALLRRGANVNARFGEAGYRWLMNPWTGGVPFGHEDATPLIALSCACNYPDPPRKIDLRDSKDIKKAWEEYGKATREGVEERKQRSLRILSILLSHNCELDAEDGLGATALFHAITHVDGGKEEMAKVLMEFGANVNVKTKETIDSAIGITPLHQAHWSPALTKLLIAKGADLNAKDSEGRTPLDYAKHYRNEDVVEVYESP